MLSIAPGIIGIVGKIWSWLVARHRSRLSPAESRLLAEGASAGGTITKLSTGQTGEFVQVGPISYLDDNKSLKRVEALQALDSLLKRGFFWAESSHRYLLTPAGFKRARK